MAVDSAERVGRGARRSESWFFTLTHDSPLAEPVSSYSCNQQKSLLVKPHRLQLLQILSDGKDRIQIFV